MRFGVKFNQLVFNNHLAWRTTVANYCRISYYSVDYDSEKIMCPRVDLWLIASIKIWLAALLLIRTLSVTNELNVILIVTVTDGVTTPTSPTRFRVFSRHPWIFGRYRHLLSRCYRRWPTHTSICYRREQAVLHFADNRFVLSTLETARLILGQKPTGQDSNCQLPWPQLNFMFNSEKKTNWPLHNCRSYL